jgi:ferrous iron transport protein B
MKSLRLLLIGQPNVGKSSLFNALVGPRVTVSNYPGTTVEVTRAKKKFGDVEIEFVDTPGIYSISDRSEEEKVTEKVLFEEKRSGVIVLADAVSLERSLYTVLQILEAQVPTILALNFLEDAKKKGIRINCRGLSEILHIPVIPINPLTGEGLDKLLEAALRVNKILRRAFAIEYSHKIEEAVAEILPKIKRACLPKRFIALRILEKDKDFYKFLSDRKLINGVRKDSKGLLKIAEDVPITRYGTASFIAEKVTRIVPVEEKKGLEEMVDSVLLHEVWGPLTSGFSFLAIFGGLLFFGNLAQGFFMDLVEKLLVSFGAAEFSITATILIQGLTGLAAGVSIALPYVFLFYLLLGLLEDIGLLSRFIVNAERFLRKLSLPGKSFIPLVLGLGCTAPAARATRVLSSKKEQFYTASLLAFIPCSSRIAIIMGIAGFYGGVKLAFLVLATLLIAGWVWAFGVKKIVRIRREPLLLELPPYRMPLIKNVLAKSWIRMKDFVYIVMPLLVAGGIAYGVLDTLSFTDVITRPLSPVAKWLGLPVATIIPLTFGFLQKDLTGAMLLSVLGDEISLVLTPLQIYTFAVASTIGVPCIIALGMLTREFGFKKSITLAASSIFYGIFLAGLIWRVVSIF